MTAQRFRCPAAQYIGLDRHIVTDRRWTLTDPADLKAARSEPASTEAA